MISYNKVISIEDFSNVELCQIIGDAFCHQLGINEDRRLLPNSRQWKVGMSVRALRDFEALNSDSRILGVGAGTEVTSFYLTKHAKQVFATDLYLSAGIWSEDAQFLMFLDPHVFAPYPYEKNKLVVQHMDGRWLNYPDRSFDGIYCIDVVEHLGSMENVANACYEMGRVLKPGGVLTIVTKFKISGPNGSNSWNQNILIPSKEDIFKYIIEASGLMPVDDVNLEISEGTMLTHRDLSSFMDSNDTEINSWIKKVYNPSNLIIVHEGFVFCPVHLTLRKTDSYPLNKNDWAAPSEDMRRQIEQVRQQVASDYAARSLRTQSSVSATMLNISSSPLSKLDGSINLMNQNNSNFTPVNHYKVMKAHNDWQNLRLSPDISSNQVRWVRWNPFLKFLYRTLARIRKLGKIWEAERCFNESVIYEFQKVQQNEELFQSKLQNYDTLLGSYDSTFASLKTDLANSDALRSQLEHQLIELEVRVNNLKNDQNQLQDQLQDQLQAQLASRDQFITNMEVRLRDNVGFTRFIAHQLSLAGILRRTDHATSDKYNHIIDIVRSLEQEFPQLAQMSPVDVWVAPTQFEAVLFNLVNYFKPRINPFSLPLVIYHIVLQIDDTGSKLSPELYNQLKPNGIFVLISPAQPTEITNMRLIYTKETSLDDGIVNVSVYHCVQALVDP